MWRVPPNSEVDPGLVAQAHRIAAQIRSGQLDPFARFGQQRGKMLGRVLRPGFIGPAQEEYPRFARRPGGLPLEILLGCLHGADWLRK